MYLRVTQTFNLWLDLRPYSLGDVSTSPIQFNAVGMTSSEFANAQVGYRPYAHPQILSE